MDDHIAEVHHHPAVVGLTLNAALPLMIFADGFLHRLGERIQHAAACSRTDHEIIGEGCNILDIDQQNILALFIFQGINQCAC
jgi:hypothetical protein